MNKKMFRVSVSVDGKVKPAMIFAEDFDTAADEVMNAARGEWGNAELQSAYEWRCPELTWIR
jgi:hypothetical protein